MTNKLQQELSEKFKTNQCKKPNNKSNLFLLSAFIINSISFILSLLIIKKQK